MAGNRITEGVGKKIVEALKQQSDVEITPMSNDSTPIYTSPSFVHIEETDFSDNESDMNSEIEETTMPSDETNENYNSSNEINSVTDDLDLPANVAVLKQLISKLPSGVSKQTGAQIIKQTMEALGISMNSVLQEAQQVQENLDSSARDCKNSILEYKKQINVLEGQAQKYQKQFSAVNDIISLFIQTGI